MMEPQPLNTTPAPEVPRPRAPLERVIAQARFPPILTIRSPDKVAVFQEVLRGTYPILSQEQVHSIELGSGQTPNISQGLIWRLADQERDPGWRVSLGVDFVALETSAYDSWGVFLERLCTVLSAVEQGFKPASASRLGLRYIDRLMDEAVDRVTDLVQPDVLGIVKQAGISPPVLGQSVVHLMTEAQFVAQDGARVQGRWGLLPANATYDPDGIKRVGSPSWVLDLDMFTTESQPFASEKLLATATGFATCLYWLFREMVTEEFLRFYGGSP